MDNVGSVEGERVNSRSPPVNIVELANDEDKEAESVMRKATYEKGDWYYGEFKGDVREGKGLYVYAEGIVKEFEGDFKSGFGEGQGVFRFRDGSHYCGSVAAGMMHGRGRHVSTSGDVYEGLFLEGEKHHHGVYTSKCKRYKYEGEYVMGKRCGLGTFTQTGEDGQVVNRYTGQWKNNTMQGQGVYEYGNGDIYSGKFNQGKRSGQGVMTFRQMPGEDHKAQYSGEWRMDKYHGRGVFRHADGVKVEDCMWRDGNKRALPEEDLWWDDQCICCHRQISLIGEEQMLCCETCPNVAHLSCINENRKNENRSPQAKNKDFFCEQRYASTGLMCLPPGGSVSPSHSNSNSTTDFNTTAATNTAADINTAPAINTAARTNTATANTTYKTQPNVAASRDETANIMMPSPPSRAAKGSVPTTLRNQNEIEASGQEESAEAKLRKRKKVLEAREVRIQKKRKEQEEQEKKKKEQRNRVSTPGYHSKVSESDVEAGDVPEEGVEVRRGTDEMMGEKQEADAHKDGNEENPTAVTGLSDSLDSASVSEVIAKLRGTCDNVCAVTLQLSKELEKQRIAEIKVEEEHGRRGAELPGGDCTHIFTSFTILHHLTAADCPENKDRIILLHQDLSMNTWGLDFGNGLRWSYNAPPATKEDLLKVHEEEYLEFLRVQAQSAPYRVSGLASLSDAGTDAAVSDSALSVHSVEALMAAAGCVLEAMDAVAQRRAKNVFCLIRPPGHHAASSKSLRGNSRPLNPTGIGSGFCLINNVLIGAKYAKDKYGWRVAVVDFDVHHGNGTEQVMRYGLLKDENGIMLCSVHQYSRDAFPGTGGRQNTERNAEDGGAPWIINVPISYTMPKKCRDSEEMDSGIWRKKVVENILPHLQVFKPDLVIMSAGFDGHKDDPVGELKLDENDFNWITKALVSSKAIGATVPHVVSVLEGGYGIDEGSNFSLSRAACAHVQALTELKNQGASSMQLDWDQEKEDANFQRCKSRIRKRITDL